MRGSTATIPSGSSCTKISSGLPAGRGKSDAVTLSFGRHVLALGKGELPDRALVGGKAWSIARMSSLGLNVPPAIVITTEACREYMARSAIPDTVLAQVADGVEWLQASTGRTFGGGPRPLLLSVRSGAAVSLP